MAKIKIRITAPVAGKFGLSHNMGDVVSIEEKQAEEIIAAKCGEKVTTKAKK